MSDQVQQQLEEDFEVLMAQKLCGELEGPDVARLEEIMLASPELRARHDDYLGIQSVLNFMPAGALENLEEAELDEKKVVSIDRFRARRRMVGGLSAAAAAVVLGLGTVWYLDRNNAPVQFLSFPHGRCTSGGKKVAAGGKLGGGLSSGKGSFCDAQIRGGGRVAVRVMPNSKIDFEHQGGELNIMLRRGQVIVDAEKRARNRPVRIHTPGHAVRLVGTKLMVTRRTDDSVRVDLVKGKLRIKSAPYLLLRSLEHGVSDQQEQEAAKQFPTLFQSKNTDLSGGQAVVLKHDRRSAAAVQRTMASLDRALQEKRARTGAQAGEILNSVLKETRPADRAKLKVALGRDKIMVKRITLDERRKLVLARWGHALGFYDPGTVTPEQLKQRFQKIKPDVILKRLRKLIKTTLIYRIHLKDGRILTGIVESEGKKYRLTTNQGDILINQSEVDHLELLLQKE